MSADPRSDLLFGKIALNWRLINRDFLNRALHYQQSHEPHKPLGEILLEKGVLTRQQVNEILGYQQRIAQISSTSGTMSVPPDLAQQARQGQQYPGQAPHGQTPHGQQAQYSQQSQQQYGSQAYNQAHGSQAPYNQAHGSHAPMGQAPTSQSPHGSWATRGGQAPGGYPGANGGHPGAGHPGAGHPGGVAPTYQASSEGGFQSGGALGPTPSPDEDPLVGSVIGGCTISAKIGQGGMGAIYLAHHEALRKDVVVKILPVEGATSARTVERFFREARASAKLEHPNVVAVQDVGTTDAGLNYIVMQYIDGEDLEERIQKVGRHSPEDAVRTTLQIASGLKAAHDAGVIHRDIKAENILITTTNVVKVTDFGLAKDLNSELKLTADGAMIGTPLYMAPEIGRVKEIDGRVDVYSLGVTFYYLLTGVQPFRGFSALEILSAKAHDKLTPPEEHFPELTEPFRNVLGKMLEKDRDQRYANIDELIRDLEGLDRGFPVSAGEPSVWAPRGSKGKKPKGKKPKAKSSKGSSGKRNNALFLALGAVVLGIIALIGILIKLLS